MSRQTNLTTLEMPPSETLRHCRGSPLSGSPNRCISDFANAASKFLASLGTSDMPGTLSEIRLMC